MGLKIGKLVIKENIENIETLNGKIIAFDMSNILYQLLASIRLSDGNFIRNKDNEVVSHLYGLFFKTCFFMSKGIAPVFIFDGMPPNLKLSTLESRNKKKEESKKQMNKAITENNIREYKKYSKRCFHITNEILNSSKELLKLMGVPIVQSPSEGEAQASYMSASKTIDFVSSQDYDTLLFGANYTIRNLTVTASKLKNKELKPEVLSLYSNLNYFGITREQLIDLCLCIGTDFNEGIPQVGYKKALKLIKKYSSIDLIIKNKYPSLDIDSFHKAKQFFLNPPVLKTYNLNWNYPKIDNLLFSLCDKYNFNNERISKFVLKYESDYFNTIQKINLNKK